MKRIVLIGSGNVASNLGKALKKSGHHIIQVWSKTLANAQELANTLDCEAISDINKVSADADAYIFSVKDDALLEMLKAFPLKDKVLLHTAGSISIDVLKPFSAYYGVFYPLQTFSKQKEVDFREVPILLESSCDKVGELTTELAHSLSTKVIQASSEQRKYLHIAAVFSCNFVNHLYAVAEGVLVDNGLSLDLIRPLIQETADKAMLHSPKEVQTGPAVRRDMKIVNSHLELLDSDPEIKALYASLSEGIMKQ